jgi:hypothetical protein
MIDDADRAQWEIEIDRSIARCCPKCGSGQTVAGGTIIRDGAPHDVGVMCYQCGYWHDGTKVEAPRPFLAPGTAGSHDQAREVSGV